MKKQKYIFILLAIFLVAFTLRVYRLNILPFDFHEDEVLSGYIGRFLWLHGKDLYGNSWPLLYFNKFGDYYIIFPMYLAGLSTFLFGINEFAVRFPTAFMGALIVFPLYFFSKTLFNNKKIGLIAALMIAINPWHINLSRTMAEGIIGSTIFLTALAFLICAIKKNRLKFLFVSLVFFLLGYLIYHPFRIYAPASFVVAVFFYFSQIKRNKQLVFYLFFALMLILLTSYIMTTPWGSGRLMQTSIFNAASGVTLRMQELIFSDGPGKILLARSFHNKIIGFGREFLSQYLSYFSPVVLFVQGGKSPRFAIPEQGLIYISYFLLIMSLLIPFKNSIKNKPDSRDIFFLAFILLLSPFPAAFTIIDSPNIHRTIFMVVPLAIFAAYGFYRLTQISNITRLLVPIMAFMILIEGIYFWHQYSSHSDLYDSVFRNDGQREVVQYVVQNHKKYDTVFLPSSGTMAIYYLFYSKDFDEKYVKEFGFDVRLKKADNVFFVDEGCPAIVKNLKTINKNKHYLFVNLPNCDDIASSDFRLKKTLIHGINPLLSYKIYAN